METTLKISVKEIVKDTIAKFEYAAVGKIWYKVIGVGNTYLFPVDITNLEDVGTTKFEAEYKSISLMRYINKAIKNEELVIYPTIK